MYRHPITIVGAGLAGLALGRCLKQHGIASIVLEKAPSSARHNYGITLHPWAYRPLLKILQIDEQTFQDELAVDSLRPGKGAIAENALGPGINKENGTFRCHRGRLGKLLQKDQDIRWEHTVQHVTASSQGILVHLKDAKPLETETLIGTDGVHSQVRKSLAPEIKLKVLPFVVFNGKRRLTRKEYQELFEPKLGGQTIVQSRHEDTILEISVNDFTPEHVTISYNYSRPARTDDLLHKPDRTTTGATEIPEEFYGELSSLKHLQQPFQIVFDPEQVRRDRILHWLMRSTLGKSTDISHLAKQGVLLVGDAVHAMPILGGEGANHAIKDGVDLANHIIKHGTEHFQDFADAKYESWKKAVEDSEKRLEEMHGPTKASL